MNWTNFLRAALGALPAGMMYMSILALPLHGPRPILLATLLLGPIIIGLLAGREHSPAVFAFLLLFAGGSGILFLLTDMLRPMLDETSRVESWPMRAYATALYGAAIAAGAVLRRFMRRA